MKWGALYLGCSAGFFSLLYLGVYGGIFGGFLNWASPQLTVGGFTGDEIRALALALPLLAMAGGAICGANPGLGGSLLFASAAGHWWLMGFTWVSEVFILSIGLSGALGIAAWLSQRDQIDNTSSASISTRSAHSDDNYDRTKWNALIEYDGDIANAAKTLSVMGDKWVNELARSYLALNDKAYLSSIVEQITTRAKAELEQSKRLEIAARQAHERRSQSREKIVNYLVDLSWSSKTRKITSSIVAAIVVTVVVLSIAFVSDWSIEKRTNGRMDMLSSAGPGLFDFSKDGWTTNEADADIQIYADQQNDRDRIIAPLNGAKIAAVSHYRHRDCVWATYTTHPVTVVNPINYATGAWSDDVPDTVCVKTRQGDLVGLVYNGKAYDDDSKLWFAYHVWLF